MLKFNAAGKALVSKHEISKSTFVETALAEEDPLLAPINEDGSK